MNLLKEKVFVFLKVEEKRTPEILGMRKRKRREKKSKSFGSGKNELD